MAEVPQFSTIGMFWSIMLLSAMSASAGCILLSKATISSFLPSTPPRALTQSTPAWMCLRLPSPVWAKVPDRPSV